MSSTADLQYILLISRTYSVDLWNIVIELFIVFLVIYEIGF